MKKTIFSLFALLLFTCSAFCQVSTNIAKEEEAIKALIIKELDLWLERDYISEADLMVKEDYFMYMNTNQNYSAQTIGFDSLLVGLKRMAEGKWRDDITNQKFKCKYFNIKVHDDIAWAMYYVQSTGENKGEPFDETGIRVTILEKVNGKWKMALNSITPLNPCDKKEYGVWRNYEKTDL